MQNKSFQLNQDKFYVTCISEKNVDKFVKSLSNFSDYPIIAISFFENINNLESIKNENVAYIIGKHELKYMANLKKSGTAVDFLNWLESLNISITFVFPNGSKFLIMNGGITNEKSSNDFTTKMCFVENWQAKYKGSLGYIISAENHKDNIKYYNYSASLSSLSNNLIIQEVNSLGLGESFIL